MTDKRFIQKIKKVEILPDPEFKLKHREILLAQINSGHDLATVKDGFIRRTFDLLAVLAPGNLSVLTARPLMSLAVALLAVVGGGSMGILAAKDSMPGDKLYAAKIVSEKTQLAITFGEKQRAKLGIEFASNRAQELTQIMNNAENSESQQQIKELADNVIKEIDAATDYLAKVGSQQPNSEKKSHPASAKVSAGSASTSQDDANQVASPSEEARIFSANLGKNQENIQISSPTQLSSAPSQPISADAASKGQAASSSAQLPTETKVEKMSNMLSEAKKMIEADDIAGSVEKLEAARTIINQLGTQPPAAGEVKGVEEAAATSTAGQR